MPANAAGANALGPSVEVKAGVAPKENGAVVVGVDETKVEVGVGASSLLPNIEVPVENVELGIEKGEVLGEKVVEVGAWKVKAVEVEEAAPKGGNVDAKVEDVVEVPKAAAEKGEPNEAVGEKENAGGEAGVGWKAELVLGVEEELNEEALEAGAAKVEADELKVDVLNVAVAEVVLKFELVEKEEVEKAEGVESAEVERAEENADVVEDVENEEGLKAEGEKAPAGVGNDAGVNDGNAPKADGEKEEAGKLKGPPDTAGKLDDFPKPNPLTP